MHTITHQLIFLFPNSQITSHPVLTTESSSADYKDACVIQEV